MSGLGIGPGVMPLGVALASQQVAQQVLGPSLALDAERRALEAETVRLQAEIDAVRAARGGDGWPWWAKLGGGILAVTAAVAIARRWRS
jgi:hypothetical protein